MREIKSVAQSAAEDIYFGQIVMIWARWFLIAAGVILALWSADDEGQAALGILPVMGLIGLNFYLHGRYLAQRPANPFLITMASILDVAVVTLVIVLWPGQQGFDSPFFILYYPVVLAFAFVMPVRASAPFTALTLGAYAAAVVLGLGLAGNITDIQDATMVKTVAVRLITLASMGGLGAFYWRIQRSRREPASSAAHMATEAGS